MSFKVSGRSCWTGFLSYEDWLRGEQYSDQVLRTERFGTVQCQHSQLRFIPSTILHPMEVPAKYPAVLTRCISKNHITAEHVNARALWQEVSDLEKHFTEKGSRTAVFKVLNPTPSLSRRRISNWQNTVWPFSLEVRWRNSWYGTHNENEDPEVFTVWDSCPKEEWQDVVFHYVVYT